MVSLGFNCRYFVTLAALLALVTVGYCDRASLQAAADEGDGIIRLTTQNYDRLLSGPREDYYVSVFLTAKDPRVGCHACLEFNPSYAIVGRSYNLAFSKPERKMFFAIADLADAREVFAGLGLKSVPHVWVYNPTTSEESVVSPSYEKTIFPFVASNYEQNLLNFYTEITGQSFSIRHPVRYDRIATLAVIVFFTVLGIRKFGKQILHGLRSLRVVMSSITMVSCIVFVSGYMFNIIREVPYSQLLGDGTVVYFQKGHNQQFAVETQIMCTLYGSLAVSVILLVRKVPGIDNPKRQVALTLILVAVIFVLFSLLIDIYHIKNGGYPFHFMRLL